MGTEDALARATETLYESLDLSQQIAAVFLDIAKAFDTINHKILIRKLEKVGIRGQVLEQIIN